MKCTKISNKTYVPMTKSLKGSVEFWRNFRCIHPSNWSKEMHEVSNYRIRRTYMHIPVMDLFAHLHPLMVVLKILGFV